MPLLIDLSQDQSSTHEGHLHVHGTPDPLTDRWIRAKDYAKLCAELGVTQSMGAVGSSADNALAESFNATLKREVLQDAVCWPDEATCRRQLFRWLVRYNTRRRHSWCGYLSPSTYEARRAATLPTAA